MLCRACLPTNEWKDIRARILKRAKDRCEQCRERNYLPHRVTGSQVVLAIVHLGTAHPNSLPSCDQGDERISPDGRDENLTALCQRCHLRRYVDEHHQNRRSEEREARALEGQLTLI